MERGGEARQNAEGEQVGNRGSVRSRYERGRFVCGHAGVDNGPSACYNPVRVSSARFR